MTEPAPSESSATAAPDLAPGTLVAERYRVERLLGKGGMGVVYRAEHVHMKKAVALKVLHRELLQMDEVVARFEREAIAAGRIEHPNVAAATDFGKLADGSFYLALEYVDGSGLRDLLDQGPLPIARALEITRQTALALRAAHAAGIVHRDLKPDNVLLVAGPDGGDRVKVLDFGIARVTLPEARREATNLTRVGVVMGTVAYMSPEQATGQEVDGRTDLYALGVMLYEMIAGHVPFEAELMTQVLARQITELPPKLPATTPAPLAALVDDLLEKKPADRPPTADAVLERLAALQVTPSGHVPPPRVSRRKLVWIGAGVAAALLALAALAGRGGGGKDPSAGAEAEVGTRNPVEPVAPAPAAVPTSGEVASPAPAEPGGSEAEPAKPAGDAKPSATSTKAARSRSSAPKTTTTAPAKSTGTATTRPAPQETGTKRRTGPGGIYIPPPNTWFKLD